MKENSLAIRLYNNYYAVLKRDQIALVKIRLELLAPVSMAGMVLGLMSAVYGFIIGIRLLVEAGMVIYFGFIALSYSIPSLANRSALKTSRSSDWKKIIRIRFKRVGKYVVGYISYRGGKVSFSVKERKFKRLKEKLTLIGVDFEGLNT
ncbi:MAG: hypothetical protein ACP5T2_04475 [Thermoprotei archaeon]